MKLFRHAKITKSIYEMTPRPKDLTIWREWEQISPPHTNGVATAIWKCKHCPQQYAENVSQFNKHLQSCKPYQDKMKLEGRDNIVTTGPSSRQTTLISGYKMTKERKEEMNISSAMALYMGGLALRTFHAVWMKQFLYKLSFETWSPPDVTTYSNRYLDICYNKVKLQVDGTLKALALAGQKLHFILDESTDRRSRRMINISTVQKPFGSFFLTNKDSKDASLGGQYFYNWFKEETAEYTGGNTKIIGSMTTDTCATMRRFRDICEQSKELSHVIFAPCDSHGLQLLIRDLCLSPWFKPILKSAQSIARGFHQAKKQYAILREIQQDIYQSQRALILSVLTRWGTQYYLCKSLLDNREALRVWALRADTAMGKPGTSLQKDCILSDDFWGKLDKLCVALEPIHKEQKKSEATEATLGDVVPRWLRIKQELQQNVPLIPALEEFISDRYAKRRKLQVRPIHTVAMFLLPVNRTKLFTPEVDQAIMQLLWSKCTSSTEKTTVHKSFHAFRSKRDGFEMSTAWIHLHDPSAFWQSFLSVSQHSTLARIAVTIFDTPANSVASERAFSCMGLITNALRNRLAAERATKLIYIHMNQRVLDANSTFQDWQEGTQQERVELENLLLQMEEEEGISDFEEAEVVDDIEIEAANDELAVELGMEVDEGIDDAAN